MASTQRYVVVGILAMAFIVGMALGHAFNWIWVQFGLHDPNLFGVQSLQMSRTIGWAMAALAAFASLRHAPTRQLATEVVDELSKVTWPSREETGSATVVVVVTVIICALFLGAFDAVWNMLTDWLLGISGASVG